MIPAAAAPADIVVTSITGNHPDDAVTIIAGSSEISGWQDVDVTLRLEGFPNSFSIAASVTPEVVAAASAGQPCKVLLGNDLVISGFIDRDVTTGTASSHNLELLGRGKTQDLVDCSAEWPSGQIIDGDALSIAQSICEPYGLSVELGEGADAGPTLPGWLLNYGETGAGIIQSVARNAKLLAYEDAHGVLLLAKVGTKKAASGIAYGSNVQAWGFERSADGRFSDYVCSYWASDFAIDVTGPGDIFFHRETDPWVKRHRQLDFVLESVASLTPADFTIARAQWEAARRAGRATVVTATVDSWRDSAGKLWAPNTLVPVDLPGVPTGDLVLGEVTFRRSNDTGTTADLVLMPATAFTPEPLVLQPVAVELVKPSS